MQQLAPPGMLEGVRTQMRVISAIILRELHTRFGRHHLGYVWIFIEPMILGACIAGIHAVKDVGMQGGIDVVAFYLVGYTPYYLFRAILNRAGGAVVQNTPLFYHRQISYLDIMIARNTLDTATVMIAIAIMVAFAATFTGAWPDDWLKIALGVMMIGAFCHGLSLLLLAATVWGHETVDRVVHPMTYLMIPFTGAFVMVWWLPYSLQEAYLLIPSVGMFELVREGMFGPVVPHHYHLDYMLTWTVGLNVLGMLALRATRGRLTNNH
jgi:capsular polysaccharide transport system permease protein